MREGERGRAREWERESKWEREKGINSKTERGRIDG